MGWRRKDATLLPEFEYGWRRKDATQYGDYFGEEIESVFSWQGRCSFGYGDEFAVS